VTDVIKIFWNLFVLYRRLYLKFSWFQTFALIWILYFFLGISPASNSSWPTFRNPVSVPSSKAAYSTSSLWRWNWHTVPKRRPTKIWRLGNTQYLKLFLSRILIFISVAVELNYLMLSKSYRSLVLCIFYHEVAFKNYSCPPELFIFICTVYQCDKKTVSDK